MHASFNFSRVILNVGGEIYVTTVKMLTMREPNSKFAVLFSGKHIPPPPPSEPVIINRDGKYFGYILSWLGYGIIPKLSELESIHLLREAEYYQLYGLIEYLYSDGNKRKNEKVEPQEANNCIKIKNEEVEKECKKMKNEESLCTHVKIHMAIDKEFTEKKWKGIFFDVVDHDNVQTFLIQKEKSFFSFKHHLEKEFGIPIEYQRFWLCKYCSYRPHRPLTPEEETSPVEQIRGISEKEIAMTLRLFLEIEHREDLRPLPLQTKTNEDILLFFKLYIPEQEEFRYIGRLYVKAFGRPTDILNKLRKMADLPAKEEIELYKEVKNDGRAMRVDTKITFALSQFEDGDVVCFQKSHPIEGKEQPRYPDVLSLFDP